MHLPTLDGYVVDLRLPRYVYTHYPFTHTHRLLPVTADSRFTGYRLVTLGCYTTVVVGYGYPVVLVGYSFPVVAGWLIYVDYVTLRLLRCVTLRWVALERYGCCCTLRLLRLFCGYVTLRTLLLLRVGARCYRVAGYVWVVVTILRSYVTFTHTLRCDCCCYTHLRCYDCHV